MICYLYVYIFGDGWKMSYDFNSYYWRVVMINKYNMVINDPDCKGCN